MADDPILYHYTNWGALAGIVEHAELWATDWRMLNDSREYRYSRAMLDATLDSAPRRDRVRLQNALARIETGSADGAESIFVVSFTELRDDLPQWRSYAADGQGVALGFRMSSLKGLGLALKRVDYDEASQRQALADELAEILSRKHKTWRWRAQELIRTCMSHKHPGFKAEREHRLVSVITRDVMFRANDQAIVPTRRVSLKRAAGDPTAPPAIAEVVVGPRAHVAAGETLRAYLRSKYGEATQPAVSRSPTPYVGPA